MATKQSISCECTESRQDEQYSRSGSFGVGLTPAAFIGSLSYCDSSAVVPAILDNVPVSLSADVDTPYVVVKGSSESTYTGEYVTLGLHMNQSETVSFDFGIKLGLVRANRPQIAM